MSANHTPLLSVTTWEKQREHLQQACRWTGIGHGRALDYARLLREFFEDRQREREHILAAYESAEITTVFDLWQSRESDFPGLKADIARAFKKGKIISHDEPLVRSPGQSRNDLFVYELAGQLLRGGAEVMCVNGRPRRRYACQSLADVELRWQNEMVNIECKRPQKRETLSKESQKAYDQLIKTDRAGRPGLIALDCSLFLGPTNTLLESNSSEEAWGFLTDRLEDLLDSVQIASVQPAPILAGLLLHASAPAMIRQGTPLILPPSGEPFRYFRPDHISTWIGTENPSASRPGLCRELLERMNN